MLTLLLALMFPNAWAGGPKSVYTNTARCKVLSRDEETGATRSRCGTVGDYTLLVDDDDERVSLTLLVGEREMTLDFYTYVTDHFSTLGPKVEWRLRDGVPYALISRVRWTSNDPPAKGEALVISKVSKTESCIIRSFEARKTRNANHRAREIADEITGSTECMAKPPR